MQNSSIVRLIRRSRSSGERAAFQTSDLATAASLALLAPASWLLPECTWRPLCRAGAALSNLTDKATFDRTREHIRKALPGAHAGRIAQDLQAAVYELRMQNLRAWRPGGWNPPVTIEGEGHLQNAVRQGNGAILWVAHFAYNSNITKIAFHKWGSPLVHLSRPEHGFSKTRFGIKFLNPIRCIAEDEYLAERAVFDRGSPAGSMRKLYRALRRGKIVSITAGAWEGTGLGEGPLLGGRLTVSLGPPRLAAFVGAPLLPVFSVRDPAKGFLTAIEAPISIERDSSSEKDMLHAATLEYLGRHQSWIRQFPEQWRGWKEWSPPSDLP